MESLSVLCKDPFVESRVIHSSEVNSNGVLRALYYWPSVRMLESACLRGRDAGQVAGDKGNGIHTLAGHTGVVR